MNDIHEKSHNLWEALATDWDKRMGNESNSFHREIIRPATLKLLDPQPGEHILDAACGNGNFSRYLAALGAKVTAFDYSEQMILSAKTRSQDYVNQIH